MATINSQKIPKEFYCENCDYTTSSKKDYNKHILTLKHQNAIQSYTNATTQIQCLCGKMFKHMPSLYRHKKGCFVSNDKTNITGDINSATCELPDNNLISFLIKQNQDFKDLIIEQNKTIVDAIKHCSTNISNNTVNSNNTFNLNLFLHEHCKDAMNLSEFLESIKIQLADVEAVGELGYINGISKLIIQNLKGLDVTKRPIHCTDEKREIIYIKESGVWTKDEDYSKLRRFIKTVSNRNFKHTRLYKEKYPDCIRSESKYSDTYNKLIIEATGGGSKCNDYESENKIMKKIAKAITIDKSAFLTNA
jgi:hypothetical protein